MQTDPRTDILGLVDVQPTFMPGGELPVAGRRRHHSGRQPAAAPVRACLRHPGLASGRPCLLRQRASRPTALRHDRDAVRHAGAVARSRHRRHADRRDPPGHRPDPDRGDHPQGFPSDPRQLLGVLRKRPADSDRPGGMAAPARLFPASSCAVSPPISASHGRPRMRRALASPSPSSRTPAAASASPRRTAAPPWTPPENG